MTDDNDVSPCMGGWCRMRDKCPNYRADNVAQPAERLCPKGSDGVVPGFVPVLVRTRQHMREVFA